jgi:non-specific serine/threonine protein kinase
MLETTRQYSVEKLKGSGVEESAQNNHLAYFLQLAEEAEGQLIGPNQAQWLNRLEREHDNFRSALRWCMESGKGEEAARMAGALGTFWFKHSHFSEGRRLFANILERDWNISAHAQVKAWRFAGILAFWQGDAVEAIRIFTQNLERERALGDQWGIAFSLHELANIAGLEGDVEKERNLQKESIALSRKIEATWVLAMAQIALGYLEHGQGNLTLAEELYEESLHYCRRTGEKWGMELILNNLGLLNYSREDFLTAKRNFLESLELARELGDKDGMTASITGLARIYQGEGQHITSARLQGVILTKGKEIGKPLPFVEQETYDATTKALKESMGEQAYRNEFETGTTLTLNEAMKLISEQNRDE